MGWDDNAFGGSDPFADPSADCFGQAIGDADPFAFGNDSFGGDKEWSAFNNGASDDEHDFGVMDNNDENFSNTKRSPEKSGRRKVPSKAAVEETHRSKSSSRSKSGQRLPPSGSRRDHRTGSSTGRKGRDEVRSRGESSRSKSRTRPRSRSKSRSRQVEESNSDPLSLDNFMPQDSSDNPFRSSGAADPFAISPPSVKSGRHNSSISNNDGFGDFITFDSSFAGAESPRSSSGRRNNSSFNARGQAKVIHDRHGRAQRLTTSEESRRSRHSESRRSAVKDSLFSSLSNFDDMEDPGTNNGLESFLSSEKSGRGKGRRRGGGGSGDSVGGASTQSAPAANHGHYRQRRQGRRGSTGPARQSSYDDDHVQSSSRQRTNRNARRLPPSGPTRRSRSAQQTMVSPSQSPRKQKIDLDVNALAEHGHLEVVDGKMRLVLDVDTLTR